MLELLPKINNRNKNIFFIGTLLFAFLISNTSIATAASPSKSVVVGLSIETQSFDPAQNLGAIANSSFHTLVYEGLVSVDTSGKVTNVLANHWNLSKDNKVYTFKIRQGVKFHNGAKLTASDVVYSLNRAKSGAPQVAQRFAAVKSFESVGTDTVVVTMTTANLAFIYTLADPTVIGTGIVPNGYTAEQIAKAPVGTGPFEYVSYSPGSELNLKKYEGYWNQASRPSIVNLKYQFGTEASLLSAFIAKQVDMITLTSIPNVKVLKKSGTGTNYLRGVTMGGFWLNLSRKGATRPIEVAQAIALAIDRDKINSVVFDGTAKPGSTANPVVKYGLPISELPNYTRDIVKAKSLLASAGYKNGITLNFIYPNRAPFTAALFEVIKSSLAEAGITANIQPLEAAVWLPRFINADYDISITDQAWYSNPERYVIPRTGWQAPPSEILPELPALLAKLSMATDKERPAIFQQIQLLEAQAAYPFIGLVWTQSFLAANKDKLILGVTTDRITQSWKKLLVTLKLK